ncbi:MAG: metallophosphoesterase family protein [Balneolaceae bacterium]|nr:metallophosphoesterase family protein [Balneolaceae bacterium]
MAKLLVISDVHGSMDALDALNDRLDVNRVDKILCLGDMVGYGPEPNEVMAQLRDWNAECVLGNHDAALLKDRGVDLDEHFTGSNKAMLRLTRDLIDGDNYQWLQSLPFVLQGTLDGYTYIASHSNPIHPTSWERIVEVHRCQQLLTQIDADIELCFLGHTHQSGIVTENMRMIVNPGYMFHAKSPFSQPSFFTFDTASSTYDLEYLEFDIDPIISKLQILGFSQREAVELVGIRPIK